MLKRKVLYMILARVLEEIGELVEPYPRAAPDTLADPVTLEAERIPYIGTYLKRMK